MSKSEKPFTDEIVSCIFITAEGIAAESVKNRATENYPVIERSTEYLQEN